MASSKSVDGADGVGDVVRMIVRDSDVGADLDSVLADKGWAMIRRNALGRRVGSERETAEERGPLPHVTLGCFGASQLSRNELRQNRIGSRHCS